MLKSAKDYNALRDAFRWDIPAQYNIGTDCCDRWADASPDRTAIIDCADGATTRRISYGDLRRASNRLANALIELGVERGDRIAVLLPQRFETAVAHLTAYRMGAIALPLFVLFGADALMHRLADSGAKAVITDRSGMAKLAPLRAALPDLRILLCVDEPDGPDSYCRAIERSSAEFTPVETSADDPALLIYTSGTTGNPKGALHAHRLLLGHLPGVEMSHDFLPQPDDILWTPADWAWIGGLLDVLMPGLHHGVPVVARRFEKFTAHAAFDLIRQQNIRNVFLPPTALKLMRLAPAEQARDLGLRSVASGGEPLGAELLDWGRTVLGVEINEFYGQTECNMIVSSCGAIEIGEAGVMGRPVPGHGVVVVDHSGAPCPPDTEGDIAVAAPDPVMFLGYWNNPDATKSKFRDGPDGPLLLTGDRGLCTPDGKIRFVGREDDVITSAGYRIGPAEVEDCLLKHPAVLMAGVVGQPDPLRGHIVVAFVQLKPDTQPSPELADDIAGFVKTRLAAHEYPRAVRFVSEMPTTTTGKIIRAALRKLAVP